MFNFDFQISFSFIFMIHMSSCHSNIKNGHQGNCWGNKRLSCFNACEIHFGDNTWCHVLIPMLGSISFLASLNLFSVECGAYWHTCSTAMGTLTWLSQPICILAAIGPWATICWSQLGKQGNFRINNFLFKRLVGAWRIVVDIPKCGIWIDFISDEIVLSLLK